MNELSINTEFNGISVSVEFTNKLNILAGYSGTGKSLLISAIDNYCLNNNISCRLCSYNDMNLASDKIISICSDVDVVLLDNADLYLTNEILEEILTTAKYIVVSIKDTTEIDSSEASEYLVHYFNQKLNIEEM